MKSLSFDAYTLKWIAVIAMVLNHIGYAFHSILPFGALLLFFAVGGITYTIMAYFVVEGYRHSSSLSKYISRLLIFAVIAQAFHPMVLGTSAMLQGVIFLNVLFVIALSIVVLILYDRIKTRFLFWLIFIVFCVISIFTDLFLMGILMPLLYYTIKKENVRRTLPGIVSGVFWILISGLPLLAIAALQGTPGAEQELQNMLESSGMTMDVVTVAPAFGIGCFIGAVLVRNYNGDRGRPAKWLFYVAYPFHFALIAWVSLVLGLTEFSLFGL